VTTGKSGLRLRRLPVGHVSAIHADGLRHLPRVSYPTTRRLLIAGASLPGTAMGRANVGAWSDLRGRTSSAVCLCGSGVLNLTYIVGEALADDETTQHHLRGVRAL